MNYSERRLEIFNKYSANLKQLSESKTLKRGGKVFQIKEPCYVCPLCLEIFYDSALSQSVLNPLTLEDVPPKALGGKPVILTCKSCNNNSGRDLDSHLKAKIDLDLFMDGEKEIPSTFGIKGNNHFKSLMSFNCEEGRFSFSYSHKNPYAKREVESLISKWNESQFEFKIKGPNQRRFLVALIRVAYLLAFEKFGYAYLLSPGGSIVREQIINPEKDIIVYKLLFSTNRQLLEGKKGIHFVKTPEYLKAIFVVFSLNLGTSIKQFGLLLPGPQAEHVESFLKLEIDCNHEFTLLQKSEVDFLKMAKGYLEIWPFLQQDVGKG